jgi:hypothetical protein
MSTMTAPTIPLTPETPGQRLRRTAAAVRVHFTWMGVRRTLTREQKEEAAEPFGAEGQFLSAGKKLIDTRHEAFRKLTGVRGRIISYWRGISLPYVEPGTRLIRQSDIESFNHTMEGFREELTEAEAELNTVYDQVKADARQRLGRLFNPNDYPAEIRGLFSVSWEFPPIEPPSYLMRLNPEIYQQEQERVARRFEEAVQLAEQAFISELGRLVSHLTERLAAGPDGARKVFRDSAIANLTEFFGQFRQLNVHSNADLDALVDRAQHIVQGIQPQELRDNDSLRQHVSTQLATVQATLDGMLIDQPRRRIVRNRPSPNGETHATGD